MKKVIKKLKKLFCFIYGIIPLVCLLTLNGLIIYREIKKSNLIEPKNFDKEIAYKRKKQMSLIIFILTIIFLPIVIVTVLVAFLFENQGGDESDGGDTI